MKIQQVALQCYTIRDHCKTEEDFRKAMKRTADLGYQAVQISAVGPIAPETIKAICDENGLAIAATHEPGKTILEDPQSVIDRLKALGCVDTAYPYPHMENKDQAGYTWLAHELARVTPIYEKAGIRLSYHNHALEFNKFGDRTGMELLFDTAPGLGFELDMFWVQRGGGSPEAWCRKCQGRLPIVHIKDYAITGNDEVKMAAIGDGNLSWPDVIAAAEASGTEWFIVEQDRDWAQDDPFVAAERSINYIRKHLVEA